MRLFSRSIAPPPAPTVEAIFHKDIGFIMRVLGRCGVPDADVEDVAQEVMRAVMGALPTFDPERPRRPWLWGIAVRQAGSYCDARSVIGRSSSTTLKTSWIQPPASRLT